MTTASRLTERPLWKSGLTFGAPIGFAMSLHGLFNCVDLVIVARAGAGAVGAVTVAGIINMAAMIIFNGVATAIAARAARAEGAGDVVAAEAVRRVSHRLTAAFSIVLGLGFYFPAGSLVRLFGADDATADDARRYLEIMSLGSPTMFWMMSEAGLQRARGIAKWPSIALVVANVLNIPLDIWMVFGGPMMPALGVAGAAWATVLARAVGCAVLFFGRSAAPKNPALPSSPEAIRNLTKAVLVEGAWSSAQLVTRIVGVCVLLYFAVRPHGSLLSPTAARDYLDGVGLCIRLETIVAFFALGFGTAAGSTAGQCVGQGLLERSRRTIFVYGAEAALVSTVLGAILFFGRERFFRLAAPYLETSAIVAATEYLAWTVPGYLCMAFAVVAAQALNGMGSFRRPLVFDLLTYAGLSTLLAVFLVRTSLGSAGAWAALLSAHLAAAALYAANLRGRFFEKTAAVAAGPRNSTTPG